MTAGSRDDAANALNVLVQRCNDHLSAGNISAVIAAIPEFISQPFSTEHLTTYFNLAELAAASGQYDNSKEILQRILEEGPEEGSTYSQLIPMHLRAGDFETAGRIAQRWVVIEPSNPLAYLAVAQVELRKPDGERDLTDIVEILEAARSVDPFAKGLIELEANLLWFQGKGHEAIRIVTESLKGAGIHEIDLFFLMADMLHKAGLKADAEMMLRQLYESTGDARTKAKLDSLATSPDAGTPS